MEDIMVIPEAAGIPVVAEGLKLAKAIGGLGYEAYLVGGCVRDLVRWKLGLDGEPGIHDVDLATSMPADELARHFRTASNNGERHGTVLVFMDGKPFEVTRFRSDGSYSDGRHPDSVEFSDTFEEDTNRRDFTMNAMGMDADCRVVDHHHGIASIRSGILSAVGNPVERFSEDALRILRAGRFAARFGMKADPMLLSACHALAGRLSFLSMERVHDELTKCSTARSFAGMLHFLEDGIGKSLSVVVEWKSAARAMDNWIAYHQKPWDVVTGMAILFMSCIDADAELRRFKCTSEEIDACRFAHTKFAEYRSGRMDLVDMVDMVGDRRWVHAIGAINAYGGKCAIDAAQEEKLRGMGRSYPTQKDISAAMKSAGVEQGPMFGRILRRVRLCVYKRKVAGRGEPDAEYLDKLVASVRKECTA